MISIIQIDTSPNDLTELVALLTLLLLIIWKEAASGMRDPQGKQLSSGLNISLIPLAIVCIAIFIFRILRQFGA